MVYLLSLLALSLLSVCLAGPQDAPAVRCYRQRLQIEYASPEQAAAAVPAIAPVYDNREWAFSARWDDSNRNSLAMREHMAKFGLKGTFYLGKTQPDKNLGAVFARELQGDGCSVGGHTMNHPHLTELKAGDILWEVLANRIEWEDMLDTPLNSFAFPYGQYKLPDNPAMLEMTTEALRRAGYHHSVYLDFVRNNPYLAPGEFSSGLQVVPGDKVVEAEKFQEALDKIFKFKSEYVKSSWCIHLGVHAWQAGEEWDKLDAVYAQLANKPEWWYCNQNEWAAYSRQKERTTIEAAAPAGAMRTYDLTRPEPAAVGASVPLTLVVGPGIVKSATLDGQAVACERRGEVTVLNLPHAAAHGLPMRIGHIESIGRLEEGICTDFPGLKAMLDPDNGKIRLTLQASPDQELRDLYVTFRLPLQYQPGTLNKQVVRIAAGATETIEANLPPTRPEPAFAEGPQYWVAEIDFVMGGRLQRLFVTSLLRPF